MKNSVPFYTIAYIFQKSYGVFNKKNVFLRIFFVAIVKVNAPPQNGSGAFSLTNPAGAFSLTNFKEAL